MRDILGTSTFSQSLMDHSKGFYCNWDKVPQHSRLNMLVMLAGQITQQTPPLWYAQMPFHSNGHCLQSHWLVTVVYSCLLNGRCLAPGVYFRHIIPIDILINYMSKSIPCNLLIIGTENILWCAHVPVSIQEEQCLWIHACIHPSRDSFMYPSWFRHSWYDSRSTSAIHMTAYDFLAERLLSK